MRNSKKKRVAFHTFVRGSCGSCSSVASHSRGGHLRNIRARLQTAQVCTQRLCRHFVILKPIDLPRQARDKRRENLNKARFFSQRGSGTHATPTVSCGTPGVNGICSGQCIYMYIYTLDMSPEPFNLPNKAPDWFKLRRHLPLYLGPFYDTFRMMHYNAVRSRYRVPL